MNPIAIYTGDFTIYWSGIIIALGIAVCLCMTLALYPMSGRSNAAVWVMFPFALFFSVVLSRTIYWYCHIEQYASIRDALLNYSTGSFCIPGVILGTWLGALVPRLLKLTDSAGRLLDAASPGMALCIALIRVSALFNNSCRSHIIITDKVFQRLPVAVPFTDSAGNVNYRFATFSVEFLLMILVAVLLIVFYCDHRDDRLRGGNKGGNVARRFLLYYGAVEIIMDSTRYDSHLYHFTFFKDLNRFASFISIAQVFAAVTILCVLIHYMRVSIKARGWKWYHIALLLVYLASLLGVGYFGEYKVQRTGLYARCYIIQSVSLLVMAWVACMMYRTCKAKKKRRAAADEA
ncbi:MAG: prolipoprotein diacylglyceryl transferase [Oscillospiraceae bacterium]|nr:prolipoprotein diacylglyceryl transferase [Oscillospiraceae bacterium]